MVLENVIDMLGNTMYSRPNPQLEYTEIGIVWSDRGMFTKICERIRDEWGLEEVRLYTAGLPQATSILRKTGVIITHSVVHGMSKTEGPVAFICNVYTYAKRHTLKNVQSFGCDGGQCIAVPSRYASNMGDVLAFVLPARPLHYTPTGGGSQFAKVYGDVYGVLGDLASVLQTTECDWMSDDSPVWIKPGIADFYLRVGYTQVLKGESSQKIDDVEERSKNILFLSLAQDEQIYRDVTVGVMRTNKPKPAGYRLGLFDALWLKGACPNERLTLVTDMELTRTYSDGIITTGVKVVGDTQLTSALTRLSQI